MQILFGFLLQICGCGTQIAGVVSETPESWVTHFTKHSPCVSNVAFFLGVIVVNMKTTRLCYIQWLATDSTPAILVFQHRKEIIRT